jgi:1-acyl-sn-glycerol-3-phosphate acyltransferase
MPEVLKRYQIFGTPIEGEEGSCKSSFTELYHLKTFHTGAVRLAFEADVDCILPAMIIGPEESFLNLGALRSLKKVVGSILPLPLPVPPLPVKWVVSYLPTVGIRRYRAQFRKADSWEEKRSICRRVTRIVKRSISDEMKAELCHRKPYQPWFFANSKEVSVNVLRYALDGNGFITRKKKAA